MSENKTGERKIVDAGSSRRHASCPRRSGFDQIGGSSPTWKTVLSSLMKAAPTESTVLIAGRSGCYFAGS
jgi:transcriptional regulator with PAS, ATPase and Fis domain